MPIAGRWWNFTEHFINYDREQPGVYELGDAAGMVVYVGSSANVRGRLKDHLEEKGDSFIRQHATQYRIEYTSAYQAREKQLFEEHIHTFGDSPKCNVLVTSGR
ncbi:MAG: GIY-YIG nuclease family protein [Terriglobales bacterium]